MWTIASCDLWCQHENSLIFDAAQGHTVGLFDAAQGHTSDSWAEFLLTLIWFWLQFHIVIPDGCCRVSSTHICDTTVWLFISSFHFHSQSKPVWGLDRMHVCTECLYVGPVVFVSQLCLAQVVVAGLPLCSRTPGSSVLTREWRRKETAWQHPTVPTLPQHTHVLSLS